LLDIGMHLGVEDLVAVLAGGLGLVELHVRVPQQVSRARTVADRDST
jgi:hypothetical protein